MINNILVTGGAGYIGSHIIEQLVGKKRKIIIFDNLSTGYKKLIHKECVFVKGDLTNQRLLKKIIIQNDITSIIHLAACLNIKEAETNPKKYYKNNVLGTQSLIKACKNSNVKNIIFSSSCSVYGSINGAVSEKKKPSPQGNYASSKFKGEEIIKKYSSKYKYRYAILRYFNVVGASKSGKIGEIATSHNHLFKNIAMASLKKKPTINVFGDNYKTIDGTCIRDYMHVSDLAEIHVKSLKKIDYLKKSLILNCGYGKGISVLEVINKLKKIIKKKIIVNFKNKRPGDVAKVYADTKKLKIFINWRPKYNNLEFMLKSSIKWEKKINYKKI